MSDRVPRLSHSPFLKNGRPEDLQRLPLIDPLRWQGAPVPERRWIVPGLVPEGQVTMLGGDGGLGKSLLALQLLGACALGKPWLGRDVRRCKAIGIFCEDDTDELHRRVTDVLRLYDAEFSDLEDLALLSRVGHDNLLLNFQDQWSAGDFSALYTRIETEVLEHGAELLVLDSLHDFFGGNENSRPHARQFVAGLRTIAVEMHGAVLLTTHPSLTGRNSGTGEAGSTAWNNAVRSRLYLTAPRQDGDTPDRDYRELQVKKSNYGTAGDPVRLRWRDGVFVRDDEPTGVLGSIKRRSTERVFIALLNAIRSEGRHVSDARNAGNYAPKVFARRPDNEDHSAAEFARAMETLFVDKKIIVAPYGRPGDQHNEIVPTNKPGDVE